VHWPRRELNRFEGRQELAILRHNWKCPTEEISSSSSSSWREDSWGPLRRLSMMTVILCLLPLRPQSIANLHDPKVTRTSRSSPPDSVGLVSGLDINNLLQDLMMRWSGGVQSGHVSEQKRYGCWKFQFCPEIPQMGDFQPQILYLTKIFRQEFFRIG